VEEAEAAALDTIIMTHLSLVEAAVVLERLHFRKHIHLAQQLMLQ
jgi:hypothetical protein